MPTAYGALENDLLSVVTKSWQLQGCVVLLGHQCVIHLGQLADTFCNRGDTMRVFIALFCLTGVKFVSTADVVIQIPWDVGIQDGFYRLSYSPPQGKPASNTTFRPQDIAKGIELTDALPGTEYNFSLHYSNATIVDWLAWTASITTVPDPPSNVSIGVRSGRISLVSWNPPALGGYSAFKLKVVPLSEIQNSIKNIVIDSDSSPFTLRNLTPGASYEIQLFTVFENKESAAYISRNFTTLPNTPGRFIVWFRNETTLLVLWQPPYPPGVYSHYKVSIDPPDAIQSVMFIEKEGEPPGPAQAAFYGLIPGRAYNISVQTVSEEQVSLPTTAQYRTVPLAPRNVTFDPRSLSKDSFKVFWLPPKGFSEFDRYQVTIGLRRQSPKIVDTDALNEAVFNSGLEPGHSYTVVVKTVSGNVASWPASGNVTTRPLPVENLRAKPTQESGPAEITWDVNENSIQDSFRITYQTLPADGLPKREDTENSDAKGTSEGFNSGADSSSRIVSEPFFTLEEMLPGRNYSVSVRAVSNGIESEERVIYQATRPASPIIENLQPTVRGMNVSWKSDVTSQQDGYLVICKRNDTSDVIEKETKDPRIDLVDLYPGAGYFVQVFALSHGLRSEPHSYFQAIYPNPPNALVVTGISNSSLSLKWQPPSDSLFDGFVVKYRVMRDVSGENSDHRTDWEQQVIPVGTNEYELSGLLSGEKYQVHFFSSSYKVENQIPLEVVEILEPNLVLGIEPKLDSHNVTFVWPVPLGRVEFYVVTWEPVDLESGGGSEDSDEPKKGARRSFPAHEVTDMNSGKVSVTIGGLFPGLPYR
ncbi:unnamed protein product [Notodromas monacha]|uniref:Fibronectin type-III domain-containing protein n=1 Tax=Notodromas monacha TaxID=399045 RepID=A0A7R9C138_9CRUS|nr:unnamed protein product [Notodromas monacha]CAG0924082.1 unnamed protein product [Notodromas monacha]